MDRHNLDLFGTNQSAPIDAGLAPVLANLEGILQADTMEGIVAKMQAASMAEFRRSLTAQGAHRQADRRRLEGIQGHPVPARRRGRQPGRGEALTAPHTAPCPIGQGTRPIGQREAA